MPKKKAGMTPEEQSQSFSDAVKRMIDAGELNPTEADAAMERVVRGAVTKKGDRED
jgi:polyhydroxyalkanoate synthesis regulator phasin